MSTRKSERGQEVSLDITSHTISLRELERALAVQGDPGSLSQGDALVGGRVASVTLLRIQSNLDESATIEAHLKAISGRMPADRLRRANLPVTITFNIAVYFETAYATTTVDPSSVALAHDYSAAIQVVTYPCSES